MGTVNPYAPGPVTILTGTATVTDGTVGAIYVNNTGGSPVTITLCATPYDGQEFVCYDIAGTATAHLITWQGHSGTLISGASTYVMGVNYQAISFRYSATAGEWLVRVTDVFVPNPAGNALSYIRVNSAATAYEQRTVAQVQTDIGLPSPTGNASKHLRVNAAANAYEAISTTTLQADVGLPAVSGNGSKHLRVNSGATAYEAITQATLQTDVGLPNPSGGNETNYLRVNAAGNGFEARTPSQTMGDLLLTTIDVFALGGQSNMQGEGDSTHSPTVPSGLVLQYKAAGATIANANDPLGDGSNVAQSGCCGPSFGVAYNAATGRRVCLVPSAVGGTDQCNATAVGSDNWDTSGTLRAKLIANVAAAMTALVAAGYAPRFAGILWSQGENDAGGIQVGHITSTDYTNALVAMIAYYRSTAINGVTYSQLPFFISKTGGPYSGDNTYYKQIRDAQQNVSDFDRSLGKPTFIVFSGAVDFITHGLMSPTAGGSNLHYTQAGYNKMGHDMAQGVLSGGESASRYAQSRQMLTFSGYPNSLSAGQTRYYGVGLSATESVVWQVAPFSGTLRGLTVYMDAVPGAGQSVTFTVMVGSIASPIVVTISGGSTANGSNFTDEVAVLATQSISVRAVASGGAATADINISLGALWDGGSM